MFDPERLLGSLLSDGLRGRPGRTLQRAAFSPQGLMVLGGVAVAAYEHFVGQKQGQTGAGSPPPPPPPGAGAGAGAGPPPMPGALTPPPPPAAAPAATPAVPAAARGEAHVLTLIAAMVNAAKADGRVDDTERARIMARLQECGAGDVERAFVAAELDKPLDIDGLVARVEGAVQGAEVYAASVAAIDVDTVAEQGYLALLAARLGLPPALVNDIHARVAAARGAAPSGEGASS